MVKKVWKNINKAIIKELIRSAFFIVIALFCHLIKNRKKYQNIWVINERSNEARDNGFWLFKYIMDNKLHNNTWYIIKSESEDVKKLSKYSDRLIEFKSLKHYVYYALSSRSIGTQLFLGAPEQLIAKYFSKFAPVKKKHIYLGHGIQKDNVDFLYKINTKIDLFVISSENEVRWVVETGGYAEHEAALTGNPRNDGLFDLDVKKQILVLPTNRSWLADAGYKINEDTFLQSRFYNEYQSLLDNVELHILLEESGYELLFYLHPNTSRMTHCFTTDCERIKIISKFEIDIQKVLRDAAVLVTDYSSVCFDFAFMEKPLSYFQFDYEEFREKQYKEGWFSYKRDGFGDIFNEQSELIKWIKDTLNNDCVMGDKYLEKVRNFYTYHDQNNCKRTYESILNMGNKEQQ